MRYIVILSAILPLLESTSPTVICQACFDHICYTKRKLFEDRQITGQIAIDRMDNHLHLHYKDYRSTDHTAVIDLNYDDLRIEELPVQFSFARAVNQNTGDVYFSGHKGIYRYNAVTKQTDSFGQFRRQIWHMQFKDKLYFTEYQEKGLHYIENNITKCMSPLSDYVIDDFIIDKHDDIYFVSSFLVYRLKKGDTRPTLFSTILYSLTTDIYNNAYFMDTEDRTLYALDYNKYILREVGMFEEGTSAFRITFDKLNRIVYADATDDKVYLMAPNYSRCVVKRPKPKKKEYDY